MHNARRQIEGDVATTTGLYLSCLVFLIQIPLVLLYAKDASPIHPIVVMLPLIGVLNFKVEKNGLWGIGLRGVNPCYTAWLMLVYGILSAIGWLIALRLEGVALDVPPLSLQVVWEMIRSFAVGVSILALWEEVVNRGYIQTRLQSAWGFWGVVVTTLLFAAMHIPSAIMDNDGDLLSVSFRCLETSLAGFAFGYVYWRSGSVITTITMHGLNNALVGVLFMFSGMTCQRLFRNQLAFQLPWLIGQVSVTLGLCHLFFKDRDGRFPEKADA